MSKAHYLRRLARYWRSWLKQLEQGTDALLQTLSGRCEWLIKNDDMRWKFMNDDDIPLTNNEVERAQCAYVLWGKGSYGV